MLSFSSVRTEVPQLICEVMSVLLQVHKGSLCCCLLLVRRFSFWLVPACCMFLKCCSPYWPLLYWVTFLGFFSICTLDFDFVLLSFVFRLSLWCWCLVGLVALFIFISFAGGGLWPLALTLSPLFWILVVPLDSRLSLKCFHRFPLPCFPMSPCC